MALVIISCIVLGGLIGYVFGLLSKEEKVSFEYMKSELADPKVNILPYGFYASHYRILERIAYFSGFGNPEFFYTQINQWEKQGSRRASDLANMGYLDVRTERCGIRKRNYYSINKKGRKMLLQFNNKF